ncbi:hypothetical protein FOPG_10041 [Fusarium oxysporum f. sp. conglutinans race 2 54008]|uniref:Uncharacterized protein n=1 Tax=Fusarium oxysporum f. sp. conglutinans race 2 54008 TaxID=1089457 RepID=X0HFJ9_FUSOX|nr:hypothetical protein FOPG_10041 [Fusarium oxysporum f. sp. conglutinans race 2 54008]
MAFNLYLFVSAEILLQIWFQGVEVLENQWS